ncbi:hypothetical protein PILCRDRAFT_484179 [Piloderma croceum F 1598]|uniref:Uncharacterized protein n=1 Tax=Piloderma croceum (strain F 1598) TaxID=765440 RepID=A0A0C3BXA7_PILCF|nr:hypothetical protein PILCRDRAFT_484179 [Piloderma croceum F 1598]
MRSRIYRGPLIRSMDNKTNIASPDFVLGPGGQVSVVNAQEAGEPVKTDPSPIPASELLSELLSQMSTRTTPRQSQTQAPSAQVSQPFATSVVTSLVQSTSATPPALSSAISASMSGSSEMTSSVSSPEFSSSFLPASSSISSSFSQTSATSYVLTTSVYTSSSSASSSSTVTDHAVSNPTEPSQPTSHESFTHTPVFYISIVLGTLVVIAIICSLGAWWFRISVAKKRQRDVVASALSWDDVTKGNGDAFGAQRAAHFRDAIESENSSSADLTGDRDVGEPRRGSVYQLPASIIHRGTAESFSSSTVLPRVFSGAKKPRNNSLPGRTPFYNASFPDVSLPGASFPMTDGPYPTTRPLPRRLSTGFTIDENIRTLGPLQVANLVRGDIDDLSRPSTRQGMRRTSGTDFGSPREQLAGETPRFMGLEAGGLAVPWSSSRPRSGPTRARESTANARAGTNPSVWSKNVAEPAQVETDLANFPPLLTPGGSQGASYGGSESLEEWATKVESTFTKNGWRGRGYLQSENTLAKDHHRVNRRLLHHKESGSTEDFGEEEVKRADTRSTAMSKPWTLEETGNGAGIVHIRGLGVYCGSGRASAGVSQTTLDLDNESIRSLNVLHTEAQDSQTPLVIRKKSRAAVGKQHDRNDLSKGRAEAISRGRSARPMRSSEDEYFPRAVDPSMSRIPRRADTMRTPTSKKEPGRSKRSNVTRSSPSSSSPVSFGAGQSRPRPADSKEKDAKAAIPDIKKKSSVGAASRTRRQPRP